MIILGIDPGSQNCGYGILQVEKRRIVAAGCDVIKTDTSAKLENRLTVIYENIKNVIDEYKPEIAAVETIFYGKNIKSAFTLGHARGVIMLALAQSGIQTFEYSPREVKQSVVGNGNASKEQVEFMVQKILNMDIKNKTQDATDALAIALCQFNKERFRMKK
ncbi:MAG: crossover junction endodeoxyribonuclease RuvC [Candidatus Cloacimonetes bacterium]|nr:crossover junction endodeoxyribonuclease RuvC [Candidatus Cloacimonadota bacterium]MCF7813908.1 crossover junction endodeoxyribonuclease RuvC [Candidatus Cloacimonadota bacterium]MCF7868505.1 crossover junction endodeoxyribonuclease RuvC [Candidatus Cloacimonadota bacterium]MCF7884020.1 crossover junction endodeoxyribonuclease RuvC [Candidatus Cloacimonadota bacterium]